MAVRTVRVGPDEVFTTRSGEEILVVSARRRVEAAARMDTVVDICGGAYSVLYGRRSTGIEGEMVTTELLMHWRDRGDAKEQYEEAVSFEDSSGVALFSDEEPIPGGPQGDEGTEIEYVPLAAVDEPYIDADGVVRHAEDAAAV